MNEENLNLNFWFKFSSSFFSPKLSFFSNRNLIDFVTKILIKEGKKINFSFGYSISFDFGSFCEPFQIDRTPASY